MTHTLLVLIFTVFISPGGKPPVPTSIAQVVEKCPDHAEALKRFRQTMRKMEDQGLKVVAWGAQCTSVNQKMHPRVVEQKL